MQTNQYFSQVASDLKALSNKFKNIHFVAEMLDKMVNMENAEKEALLRKEKAYQDAEKAQSDLVQVLNLIDEANQKLASARVDSEMIVSNAQSKAGQIEEVAKAKASEMVMEAQRKATSVLSEVKKSHAEISKAEAEIDSKKEELKQIQKQIQDVKSKIAALGK